MRGRAERNADMISALKYCLYGCLMGTLMLCP